MLADTNWHPHVAAIIRVERLVYTRNAKTGLLRHSSETAFYVSNTPVTTARHPEAAIIVPPRSNALRSETAETAPTQRDRHLQHITAHGRMAWQKASGYTKRARAETGVSRFKQVISDGLRSHTDERQRTEIPLSLTATVRCRLRWR